jgi:hypothetical protein
MLNDLLCVKHNREKKFIGGEPAHPRNLYCPDCDLEIESRERFEAAMNKDLLSYNKKINESLYMKKTSGEYLLDTMESAYLGYLLALKN